MRSICCVLFLAFLGGTAFADSKTDSLESALKTAKGDLKVKTLNELFRANLNSDPVKAIGYSREALALATEIDDRKGMASSYNNLGVAYRNQGALDKALEYYLQSLAIFEKLQNKEGIATTQNNIGTIYSMKKDYGQAMKYFEQSHKAFSELGNQIQIIGSMNNLGILHMDLQLYEEALKYFSQSLQLSKQNGKQASDPLNNIGNLYFRQGNYQKAVDFYERALELAKNENDKLTILNITTNLGEVYTRAGQGKKAQHYLDEALALSRELQATVVEPTILKSMSNNYARQGQMKEAYEAMVKYDAVRERIYGEESSRKIAQMGMALDLHEAEQEVEVLKKDSVIKTLQLRNTRMVITTVVLGIVLLIGIFNLFFSKRRSIRKS